MDEVKDKPIDVPMPVPSFSKGAQKPKKKEPAQDKTDHNSDQVHFTTPPVPDQIDTGEIPPSAILPSPVSPPSEDSNSNNDKVKVPALPFNGKDPMVKSAGKDKPKSTSKLKNPPAVPGGLSDMDIDRQIADKKTEKWLKTQGNEYQVHGKFRPDAASIQGAANKNNVSSEILRAVQTKEYTEVIVRSHLCGQYVDTIVHHDFETTRKMLLLEMASRHSETVSGFSDEGMPIFKPDAVFLDNSGKSKNLMYTVMHTLLADINFSIRDATTKAASAGQAKILNQDWQSEDELKMEQDERDLVEDLINSRNQ